MHPQSPSLLPPAMKSVYRQAAVPDVPSTSENVFFSTSSLQRRKIKLDVSWELGSQISLDTSGRTSLSMGLHFEDGAQLVAGWVGKSSLVGIS